MPENLSFILYFSFLFSLFGFMQWYILNHYFRWVYSITSKQKYIRLRTTGILFFLFANILFLLRFPSTNMGWYQYPLFQYLVIYPGGVFFGIVLFTFAILLIVRMAYKCISLLEKIPFHALLSRIRTRSTNAQPAPSVPESSQSGLISRRQFLRTTGTAVIAAPAVFTIGATAATSHDYHVVHRTLSFPNLPASLSGLRIVQISDIHSGIYMTETQMQDIFELANEQHPDLVTITGDFVDNSTSEIPALYRSIGRLKSEYGIYGCLGNHDHYASSSAVASALSQRDVTLLTNENLTLDIDGEKLTLIGVDDAGSGNRNFARLDKAVQGIPDDRFRILLSHRPDMFDDARNHRIDLTLSGHTHGGQIGFDFMGIPVYPIQLFQKYAKGLYEQDGFRLYVNVGIGMVGVPVRLVRPELTIIELTRAYPGA